jgi:hypothetical protein
MDLRLEGIPLEYMRDNREQIRVVLSTVVESNHLEGYHSEIESDRTILAGPFDNDSIRVEDSVSQTQRQSRNDPPILQRSTRSPDERVAGNTFKTAN